MQLRYKGEDTINRTNNRRKDTEENRRVAL